MACASISISLDTTFTGFFVLAVYEVGVVEFCFPVVIRWVWEETDLDGETDFETTPGILGARR